jgi:uncharacterized protein with ACT and thioredoxin-like domain
VAERGEALRQRLQAGTVDIAAGAMGEQDRHTFAGRRARIDD